MKLSYTQTGWMLVFWQFLLLALIIAASGSAVVSFQLQVLQLFLIGVGFVVGSAAIMQMRRFLRITPQPAKDGVLLQTGIYSVVRHPMYTSLLSITAGLLITAPSYTWLLWFALFLLFMKKSRFEEMLLAKQFPGYANYKKRVGGMLPRLKK